MTLSDAHVLCSMHIVFIVHFYFDICQGKASLDDQVIDFELQVFVADFFELVEVDGGIGEDISVEHCDD